MGTLIERYLTDTRRGRNTQLSLADLLRQSVYSRLAGYEDVNDAERVSADPTFRLIGSEKIWERGAALTSRLHSLSGGKTQPQALDQVQELSLSGDQLEQGPQSGRQGGASPGRAVPASRLHRHELDLAESGGRTVL